MKLNRFLSLLVALVLMLSLFALPVSAAEGEAIELRFCWWGADSRHIPYLAAFDRYHELNPNVTIVGEYQGFDGYKEKLLTQLAGGMECDIMTIDPPWYPELASRGDFFIDIDGYPADFDYSDMDQNVVKDYGRFNDVQIGIPIGYNARCVVVNKTVAETVGGLQYGDRYTWETLYEDGKRIHEAHPEIYLMAPDQGHLRIFAREILKQMTGNQLYSETFERGFTEEELADVLSWVLKCYQDGVFQPFGEANLYTGKVEQNPLWINNKLVMSFEWTGGINRYMDTMAEDAEMDIIPYPQHENKKDGASLLRPIYLFSVSKNCAHPEEALKFMNWFLNDPEAAVILGTARATPSTSVQMKAVEDANGLDWQIITATEMSMENGAARENAPSTNSELDVILEDVLQQVVYEMGTPEALATEAIKLIDLKCEELRAQ